MESRSYTVPGIHCGHCVSTIERELSELQGVQRAKADLFSRRLEVDFEPPATEAQITALMAEINYPVAS
jgi:copper chaperone CopZ